MMIDKQLATFSANMTTSIDAESTLLAQLKKEEAYINTIACPSKFVMARSTKVQELIKLLS